MLIIQMSGGLGNQMFYYAFYSALKQCGKDVFIDDFTHYDDIDRHDNCIQDIFSIQYKSANREDYIRITNSEMSIISRLKRKVFGRKDKSYFEKDALTYESEVFQLEDAYLIGYWQSDKYFSGIAEQLRKEYVFNWSVFPCKAIAYKEQIENTESISIHVRKGDYRNEKFAPIYGGICTDEYYQSAMAYMRKKYPGCCFYLFTDDKEWGKSVQKEDIILVDCTDSTNAYVDMALMGCCKHNIIANSSFSWWGAWLNTNPEKTIIAPGRWINGNNGSDIYPKDCIKIDETGTCK